MRVGVHVGVHGYLKRHVLGAIKVTIYPTKHNSVPKETTLRGRVIKTGKRWIDVRLGKRRYHFVLAKGAKVEERLQPAKLRWARKHQRVDVRYYRSGHSLVATHVLLLVIHVHHPRAHTKYGTVARITHRGFVLETIHGRELRVAYRGHVRVAEMVSVRGYRSHGRFHADKVHKLARLPVHTKRIKGQLLAVHSKRLRIRTTHSALRIKLVPSTKVSSGSLPSSLSRLTKGEYVSVRFWRQGHERIATSIHIYAHAPVHPATGAIRGNISSIHHRRLLVEGSGTSMRIRVPRSTHIRNGSKRAKFHSLHVGQRVLVRYYSEGHHSIATSIHIYAVAHVASGSLHGNIESLRHDRMLVSGPGATKTIRIDPSTHIRHGSKPGNPGSLKVGQRVLVHYYSDGHHLIATSIHIYAVAHVASGSLRGNIESLRHGRMVVLGPRATKTIRIDPSTHIRHGSKPGNAGSLKVGQRVLVHYYSDGHHLIATSIHIYAVAHATTGAIRGRVRSVRHRVIVVKGPGASKLIRVDPSTTIRNGSNLGSFHSIKPGEKVLVHYYVQGSHLIATSIHIYAIAGKTHTFTGTVVSIGKNHLQVVDRGSTRRVTLTSSVPIHKQGKLIRQSDLEVGQKLRVTGIRDHGAIDAIRIDVLPVSESPSGRQSTSFRGSVASIQGTSLVLSLSSGQKVRLRLTANTQVSVRKRSVPRVWLFAGPSAAVTVTPRVHGPPNVVAVAFHPATHAITGDVDARSKRSVDVESRSGDRQKVLLRVARVTEGSRQKKKTAIRLGSHVHVEGFVLPSHDEAALDVVISHPHLRVSGAVMRVSRHLVRIERLSGQKIVLRFPHGLRAFSVKTEQWFRPRRIPKGAHISARGIQEAGWVRVDSALLTLKSNLIRGVVIKMGLHSLILSESPGRIRIQTWRQTRISAGRQPIHLSAIEVGDDASVRAYADASGGYLASSVDLHRRSITRTGIVTALTHHFFSLELRDHSLLEVTITHDMVVEVGTTAVPLSRLANGQKVKVTGHLRPDGGVDGQRVLIEDT